MAGDDNFYCARLNVPVPRVDDFVGRRDVKLFHLLVVTLLEHGSPMTIEAIAQRLTQAGVEAATGDLVYSLKKAWHGMSAVYGEADGRMGLNLSSSDLDLLLLRLELRAPRGRPAPAEPSEPEAVSEDLPLTEAEIRWAFGGQNIHSVSPQRQAGAVLDLRGEPMKLEDVEAYLTSLTPHRQRLSGADTRRWTRSYVRMDAEGKLWLDRTSPDVPALRRAIRKLARPRQVEEARKKHWEQVSRQHELESARQWEQAQQAAAHLQRAVLRVLPDRGPAAAAALLDVGAHTIQTFVGDELASLRTALERFDLVAALGVRETLRALDVPDPDRFRLVDLSPPQKTRRLNRQGRTLAIIPAMLITSTTGISRPLSEPAKIAAYLASGDISKLRRRIESDVKALLAFYNYGRLHGAVRLRWGFLDEMLTVDWAVPGDPCLYEILRACQTAGTPVELVSGTAPGWSDPWSRAQGGTIVSLDFQSVVIQDGLQRSSLPRDEIQAVRPVSGAASQVQGDQSPGSGA